MILNKNCFYKVSTSIIKFKRNIPTNGSVKLTGTIWKSWYGCQERSCQFSLVYDAYKYYQNAVFRKLSSISANLPVGDRSALWLTDFETPAGIKTDPILNNYLIQTMENNARSGVRRVQAEKSFIFIFPSVVRTEKTSVVFRVLDQRTDYISRSSKRLCLISCCDRSSKREQR